MDGSYDIGSSDGREGLVDADDVPDNQSITLLYTKKDIGILKELWDEIFADPEEFTEYYFSRICSQNDILTAYYKNKPIGMVHLNTYEVTVYGRKTECIYIVGVCVREEYRNKGIMRSMLQKVIDDTAGREDGFLFLMPKQKEYYTGLGFESIYETCVAECNILYEDMVEERCLKDFQTQGLCLSNMSEYDDDALGLLANRINEYLAHDYRVYSVRTAAYLQKMLMEHMCQNGNVCVVKCGSTDIIGLFSYDIYDGILYAERVEIYAGNINDMLICIVKKCIENACVGCVITLPRGIAVMADINVPGMDVQLREGCGIMAYIHEGTSTLTYDMLRGNSFFDEVV